MSASICVRGNSRVGFTHRFRDGLRDESVPLYWDRDDTVLKARRRFEQYVAHVRGMGRREGKS